MSIPILILQICKSVKYHWRTLSFQYPHKPWYCHFRWYWYQHVYMIFGRVEFLEKSRIPWICLPKVPNGHSTPYVRQSQVFGEIVPPVQACIDSRWETTQTACSRSYPTRDIRFWSIQTDVSRSGRHVPLYSESGSLSLPLSAINLQYGVTP